MTFLRQSCLFVGPVAALFIACASCDRKEAPATPRPQSSIQLVGTDVEVPTAGVHTIELPFLSVDLPTGPGQGTFMSNCMICHTPRYVLMQPRFPKKTWAAEVDKMRKIYGAPIQQDQVETLVNYLVAIRGNGQ